MSNRVTEIVFNRTGQTVELYPPEAHLGIPSNMTAYVYKGTSSDDNASEFAPTVSVDTLSTTLTSDAGQGQTNRSRLNVTSSTGAAIGRLLLLDNGKGQREIIDPILVTTGIVDSAVDLNYDYTTALSTLKGIRMTFPVDSTWVADEGNVLTAGTPSYRVAWQYTIASTVYNYQTYLRLVRKQFKHSLTIHDVLERNPELLAKLPAAERGNAARRLINATEDQLRAAIRAEGYEPSQIQDTETIDELMRTLLMYLYAQSYGAPNNRDREIYVQEMRAEFAQLFGKTISNLTIPIDQGTENATAAEPIQRYIFSR